MALDSGVLPTALTNTVARVDFNAAMAALDAAFPLTKFNLDGDAVVTVKIKDLNVTTAKLALLAVTVAQLGAEAVERAKIKLLAVDTPQLEALAVEEAKIGALAVTIGKIGLLAVDTPQLQALAVTAAKIETDAVETLKIKDLNVTTAKAALGFGRFVPRLTNAVDKIQTDFTHNGAWHVDGLDLSGVVPAGATGVVLFLLAKSTGAGERFWLRHSAGSDKTEGTLRLLVANSQFEGQIILPIDSDRLLDYNTNLAGVDGGTRIVTLTVVGYFM